ncbi:MAG: flagellar assembly protein FliX [Micavibrio sp.]|nr:flagellar assembly protein FliX [Micavibrio sp.]
MKVDGPGRTKGPSKTSGKDKKVGGSNFGDFMTSGPQNAAPSQASQNIAQVDALLALQGAEDPTAKAAKNRMRARADDLLSGLEGVRNAMLTGQLTVGHMIDIADVVASHREKINDPAMTAILDEIDLRAQVELAKMRVALERTG